MRMGRKVLGLLVGSAGWAVIFSAGVPFWKGAIAGLLIGISSAIYTPER